MEFIPIKTRILQPPQDDLLEVLDEYLSMVQEGDVVIISSKVVAIHEGRCVKKDLNDKGTLALKQAEIVIPRDYWTTPATVIHHAFLGVSGIDESNGDGYLVLLPEHPFTSAQVLHDYLIGRFNLKNIGVIISDSQSLPFRYGATGVAIGWWGIEPLIDHRGRFDLFGRAIKRERSNLVDGLTAAATVVAGEVDESTPVVIVRNIPLINFVAGNTKDKLFSPSHDDKFRVLYEKFLP